MRHIHTTDGPRGRDGARLLARVKRQRLVGILVGLLLLPVGVIAQQAGDLDTSFGVGGKVITDFGGEEYATAVALQPDGKIVAVGLANDPSIGSAGFALARYQPNGTLDTAFGDDGRVITDFGGYTLANAVALQADGKIVVAGYAFDPFDPPIGLRTGFALARYQPDGTLDMTFGDDGLVITDVRNAAVIYAVALQPDGKIVVAGQAGDPLTGHSDFALARYLPNGTLDTTFGEDGLVITNFGGPNDFATAVALQPDGKIVAAGQGDPNIGEIEFALARYQPNGTLDTTFGGEGRVTTDLGNGYYATAVALQPDGKIVAAGQVRGFFSDFALARYHPEGTLDTIFGGDGRVITDLGGSDHVTAIALQPDGKIVAAGWYIDPSTFLRSFALARYLPNGSLDTTFGGDGQVITRVGSGDRADGFALVIQPHDGRLVVAGLARDDNGASDFALARYHAITKEVLNMEISGGVKAGTTVFDPTPVPEGPAGTFAFTAEFCNTGSRHLTALASETRVLTRENALRNRDSGTPPAVGSILTFSANHGYTDMRLDPGECVEVLYQIGLARRAPFRFFVDVLGVAE